MKIYAVLAVFVFAASFATACELDWGTTEATNAAYWDLTKNGSASYCSTQSLYSQNVLQCCIPNPYAVGNATGASGKVGILSLAGQFNYTVSVDPLSVAENAYTVLGLTNYTESGAGPQHDFINTTYIVKVLFHHNAGFKQIIVNGSNPTACTGQFFIRVLEGGTSGNLTLNFESNLLDGLIEISFNNNTGWHNIVNCSYQGSDIQYSPVFGILSLAGGAYPDNCAELYYAEAISNKSYSMTFTAHDLVNGDPINNCTIIPNPTYCEGVGDGIPCSGGTSHYEPENVTTAASGIAPPMTLNSACDMTSKPYHTVLFAQADCPGYFNYGDEVFYTNSLSVDTLNFSLIPDTYFSNATICSQGVLVKYQNGSMVNGAVVKMDFGLGSNSTIMRVTDSYGYVLFHDFTCNFFVLQASKLTDGFQEVESPIYWPNPAVNRTLTLLNPSGEGIYDLIVNVSNFGGINPTVGAVSIGMCQNALQCNWNRFTECDRQNYGNLDSGGDASFSGLTIPDFEDNGLPKVPVICAMLSFPPSLNIDERFRYAPVLTGISSYNISIDLGLSPTQTEYCLRYEDAQNFSGIPSADVSFSYGPNTIIGQTDADGNFKFNVTGELSPGAASFIKAGYNSFTYQNIMPDVNCNVILSEYRSSGTYDICNITGYTIWNNTSPLEYVSLSLSGPSTKTGISNDSGYFHFDNVYCGTGYKISVSSSYRVLYGGGLFDALQNTQHNISIVGTEEGGGEVPGYGTKHLVFFAYDDSGIGTVNLKGVHIQIKGGGMTWNCMTDASGTCRIDDIRDGISLELSAVADMYNDYMKTLAKDTEGTVMIPMTLILSSQCGLEGDILVRNESSGPFVKAPGDILLMWPHGQVIVSKNNINHYDFKVKCDTGYELRATYGDKTNIQSVQSPAKIGEYTQYDFKFDLSEPQYSNQKNELIAEIWKYTEFYKLIILIIIGAIIFKGLDSWGFLHDKK